MESFWKYYKERSLKNLLWRNSRIVLQRLWKYDGNDEFIQPCGRELFDVGGVRCIKLKKLRAVWFWSSAFVTQPTFYPTNHISNCWHKLTHSIHRDPCQYSSAKHTFNNDPLNCAARSLNVNDKFHADGCNNNKGDSQLPPEALRRPSQRLFMNQKAI